MTGGLDGFGFFAIAMLLLGSAIECALEILNIRHFKARVEEPLPKPLDEFISPWSLMRSLDYSSARSKLAVWSELLSACFWPALLLTGLLGYAAQALDSSGLGAVSGGLLLLLAFGFLRYLWELPAGIVSTFVVERKFGFGTCSFGVWLADQAKGLLAGGLIFVFLALLALLTVIALPGLWWLPAWALAMAAIVSGAWLGPLLIGPLFNKFEPLPDQELDGEIKEMLRKAGVPVAAVLKMDASKRTRHGNAFFTGLGSSRRIVIFDNLLDSLRRDEMLAVVAHEAGHWRMAHVPKMMAFSATVLMLGLLAAWLLLRDGFLFAAFGLPFPASGSASSPAVSLCLASLLFDAFAWPLAPLFNVLLRRFERQADAFAMRLCGSGEPLISALARLSKENLTNIHPHPLQAFFKHSHPPVPERIRLLRPEQEKPGSDSSYSI